MSWARHYFKNQKQKVWVKVDGAGEFVPDEKGRPQIRYQNKEEAKVYSVAPAHIKGPAPSSSNPVPAADPDAPPKEKQKKTSSQASPKKAPAKQTTTPGRAAPDGAAPPVQSTTVPRELVALSPPRKGIIEIHTDGACQGNPGPCSYGVVVRFGEHYKEMSQYLGHGTNNVGELMGIGAALGTLTRKDLPVHVHTDSTYAIGVLTKGWKAKVNTALIAHIKELIATFDEVTLIKVKGHSGLPLNDRVDTLAVEAIERAKIRQS